MADKPKTNPPHGMEPYDLKQPNNLGALSEEQQEKLNKFKIKTRIENDQYLRNHPEVDCLMTGFLGKILIEKPDNVRNFAAEYFTNQELPTILQRHLEDRQQLIKQNIVLKKMM